MENERLKLFFQSQVFDNQESPKVDIFDDPIKPILRKESAILPRTQVNEISYDPKKIPNKDLYPILEDSSDGESQIEYVRRSGTVEIDWSDSYGSINDPFSEK